MKLLLVVDVINGFLKEGNMAFESGQKVIEPIKYLMEDFIKKGHKVVTFRDQHFPDSLEFKSYPKHCVINTDEVLLVSELAHFEDDIIDIAKNSTNGTNTVEFQQLLSDNVFEEVVVVGVCTDICVLQSVLSLITYFYQNDLDTKVVVVKDAVDTFDLEGHDANEFNEFSLKLMENASAEIIETYKDLL